MTEYEKWVRDRNRFESIFYGLLTIAFACGLASVAATTLATQNVFRSIALFAMIALISYLTRGLALLILLPTFAVMIGGC